MLCTEDAIERLNQFRRRAVGRTQCHSLLFVATRNLPLRPYVRADIRSPKRIDGLLGIADDQERTLFRLRPRGDPIDTMREDIPKDLPLQGVGILELVHQCDAVLMANGVQEGARLARLLFPRFGDDDIVRPFDEVVKRHRRLLRLHFFEEPLGDRLQRIHQNGFANGNLDLWLPLSLRLLDRLWQQLRT